MENVLMLDMEGVFIASALPPAKRRVTLDFSVHYLNDYGIRNHAKIFLYELLPLFDEKYLNTCVKDNRAMEIMRQVFSIEEIKYYNWNRRLGKTLNIIDLELKGLSILKIVTLIVTKQNIAYL